MRFADVFTTALTQIRANKLRSFFTLLGIIVSVAFLVAVVAVIQGMNAYVKENIADALIGSNTFQVRRLPLNLGLIEDADWLRMQRRPKITTQDADVVRAALPEASAVSVTSGFPTPRSDVLWREKTLGDVLVFGVTPDYQRVQDYRFAFGDPLSEVDVRERRLVAVVGADITDKLFDGRNPVGEAIHVHGIPVTIVGAIAAKGRVLGQSFDGMVLLPITTFESVYGRRQTTTISVKVDQAAEVSGAMARAEEAMRVAHRLRPGDAGQLLRGDGGRARRFLETADERVVHRRAGRGRDRDRGRRDRDHEHHVDVGARTHARDRTAQVGGRASRRHPSTVPRRIGDARRARRGAGCGERVGIRGVDRGRVAVAGAGDRVVDRRRARAGSRSGRRVRRVSGVARRAAGSRRRDAGGMR